MAPPPASTRPSKKADLAVAVISLALAIYLTGGLWAAPTQRAIDVNSGDQALFEWLLGLGAHALTHGENPLLTTWLNAPDGVNLAVNTSITAYAVVFAPVTIWLGPAVAFTVILTLNLAATAYCWFWLFRRYLPGSTALGAAVGGIFCGFAPALVSHANAHLNWTAQWLVPLMIGTVVRLGQRRRWIRDGIILGLLIAACFSIAAEQLFFTALAGVVFVAAWAVTRRAQARAMATPVLKGLAVAAGVSGVLLAYPLWLHFAGPYGYHGTGFDAKIHSEDLAAYGTWPVRSLAGALGLNLNLAPNPTEENSFFGLPLVLLSIVAYGVLRRVSDRALVRALAVTGVVFAVLSLGPQLRWWGSLTPIPMPAALLVKLPVFNAALPSRLALVVAPVVGALLALLVSRLRALPGPRWVWVVGLVAALLPLVPTPLLVRDRPPVPHFISSGTWEQYVSDHGVLVSVPIANDLVPDGQRWQADALARSAGDRGPVFRIPAGFFLGPGGPDGTGRIGPIPTYTQTLLEDVAKTGYAPPITDAERARFRADLKYWGAEAVVLADDVQGAHWETHQPALLEVMKRLLGEPQRVDDVWLWQL
ncbi:DUF2079 domain-containing protein [Hamadaea sp. NPDC050747]|uniref:DUF2079 domain-containing protein n=1 Tax=Hamadaea sp. NPDC050747 TaxID=3155789 RepID=UPI0033C17B4D